MANLPSGNMLPTTSTSAIMFVWCMLIIILSSFSGDHAYGAHAWITDVQPMLKIKYGKSFGCFYYYFFEFLFFFCYFITILQYKYIQNKDKFISKS